MPDPTPATATLLVLAGGESRRMGRPKALLPVGGTTLVEWIVERLAPACEGLLVSARDPNAVPPGLRRHFVGDLHVGAGPLAGVEAGLAATRHPIVVAVACDMPNVTPDLVRLLVAESARHDAAVPRVGGRPEPACAAYRISAAGAIAAALGSGRLRAADALEELDVNWLDGLSPHLFRNINTPQDYQQFNDALRNAR